MPKNIRLLAAISVLLLAALACNMPSSDASTPAPIPVTTEAVDQLEASLSAAATQAAQSDRVTIEVTEAQLTSLVAYGLAERGETRIQNPQVYLRDGKLTLTGDVTESGFTLPLTAVVAVTVDAAGRPQTQIESATLGPFPLPDELMAEFSAQLDQAVATNILPNSDKMVIEQITIAAGVMTITGQRR
jgi:uncharacterized protein YpmS